MELRAACIKARDAAPMVDFYRKIFGHEPEVDGGVDFQFRPERLTVYKMGEGEGAETRGGAFIYEVADVDAEYERLVALGVSDLTPPTDKPWGVRSFLIEDPGGNMVSYTKRIR